MAQSFQQEGESLESKPLPPSQTSQWQRSEPSPKQRKLCRYQDVQERRNYYRGESDRGGRPTRQQHPKENREYRTTNQVDDSHRGRWENHSTRDGFQVHSLDSSDQFEKHSEQRNEIKEQQRQYRGRYRGNRWGDQQYRGNRWGDQQYRGNRWGDQQYRGNRWGDQQYRGNRWGDQQYRGNRWGDYRGQYHRRQYTDDDGDHPWDNTSDPSSFFNSSEVGLHFAEYDHLSIHVEYSATVAEENRPSPVMSFEEMQLHPVLTANVAHCSYQTPTPIQKAAIPLVLAHFDLLATAQTGSGKTAAFLIPIIQRLLSQQRRQLPVNATGRYRGVVTSSPRALLLAPTRELALQIGGESKALSFRTYLHSIVIYGGAPSNAQRFALQQRQCDICVATPGRLLDFLEQGLLTLSCLEMFVLDEADRMLDQGFEPQLTQIVAQLPTSQSIELQKKQYDCEAGASQIQPSLQTLLFSATLPLAVQDLANKTLTQDSHVLITIGESPLLLTSSSHVTHRVEWVSEAQKFQELIHQCCKSPECKHERLLIFVSRKRRADALVSVLRQHMDPFSVDSLHGDHQQSRRERVLRAFRSKQLRVLVATDVAARGLDLPAIGFVIQCDCGQDMNDYIHRVGRTGRMGHGGVGITYINEETPREVLQQLHDLLRKTQQEIPNMLVEELQRGKKKRGKGLNGRGGGPKGRRGIGQRGRGGPRGRGGKGEGEPKGRGGKGEGEPKGRGGKGEGEPKGRGGRGEGEPKGRGGRGGGEPKGRGGGEPKGRGGRGGGEPKGRGGRGERGRDNNRQKNPKG